MSSDRGHLGRVLTPLYFLFNVIRRNDPTPITHPGFYYGFVGVGLAWQAAFLIIATDPARFRPIMIAAILEKFSYAATLIVPICKDACMHSI